MEDKLMELKRGVLESLTKKQLSQALVELYQVDPKSIDPMSKKEVLVEMCLPLAGVPHIVTAEDLQANEGLSDSVKEGDLILIPDPTEPEEKSESNETQQDEDDDRTGLPKLTAEELLVARREKLLRTQAAVVAEKEAAELEAKGTLVVANVRCFGRRFDKGNYYQLSTEEKEQLKKLGAVK